MLSNFTRGMIFVALALMLSCIFDWYILTEGYSVLKIYFGVLYIYVIATLAIYGAYLMLRSEA